MQDSNIPEKFPIPWGNSAGASYIRQVPTASQIGITNGAASLTDGFPPLNFSPVASGGVPPFGQDMNGILNQVTAWAQWFSAGGPVAYDAAFSSAIGGYPKGTLLSAAALGGFWISTVDNNTTDPDTGGAGWATLFSYLLAAGNTWTGENTFTGGTVLEAGGTWSSANWGKQLLLTPSAPCNPALAIADANGANLWGISNGVGTLNIAKMPAYSNSTTAPVTVGQFTSGGFSVTGAISSSAGVTSNGYDAGGANFRAVTGSYGVLLRNDGSNAYLLQTASGSQSGTYNSYRPFSWSLSTGAVAIDSTGVGTSFGGSVSFGGNSSFNLGMSGGNPLLSFAVAQYIEYAPSGAAPGIFYVTSGTHQFAGNATMNGTLSVAGALTSGAITSGGAIGSNGNIVATNGRLRATFGATGSGDLNAAAILNDFSSSQSGNGYQKLPSGLMVQWGNVVSQAAASTTTYSFPTGFTNACLTVVVSYGSSLGAAVYACGAQAVNSSQFTITNTDGQPHGFNYIAIGF